MSNAENCVVAAVVVMNIVVDGVKATEYSSLPVFAVAEMSELRCRQSIIELEERLRIRSGVACKGRSVERAARHA